MVLLIAIPPKHGTVIRSTFFKVPYSVLPTVRLAIVFYTACSHLAIYTVVTPNTKLVSKILFRHQISLKKLKNMVIFAQIMFIYDCTL
jgi:energy-converting hydrogenase Eha subunit E